MVQQFLNVENDITIEYTNLLAQAGLGEFGAPAGRYGDNAVAK